MNVWTNAENHPAVSDTEWRREVRNKGDTNLTNPTRHRLRWSQESETHQPKDPNRKCLQIPLGERRIMFNFFSKLYLQSFSKVRKNWQHCSQEFCWRMWIDSDTRQIAVFPVLSDSFWAMKRGWCHLCHFWVEAGKAQVWFSRLSFLPQKPYVPDGVHVRISRTTNDCMQILSYIII